MSSVVLLVVGGSPPAAANNKVEAVDLSGNQKVCPSIPDFHVSRGSFGNFIEGKPFVCGGGLPDTTDCYSYNNLTNSWDPEASMLQAKSFAAVVEISDTEWYFSGGFRGGSTIDGLRYTEGIGFASDVNLTLAEERHITLRINETHVMMIGAIKGKGKAWLLNIGTSTWTALPNMNDQTRTSPFAGLVTFPDGRKEVVVAGGEFQTSTEIFSFDDMTWRNGPNDIPTDGAALFFGASVQFEDTFLAVGGTDGHALGVVTTTIFKFDPATEDWVELCEKLTIPRRDFTSFLVPADYIQCN
jgi:hypothetical protein